MFLFQIALELLIPLLKIRYGIGSLRLFIRILVPLLLGLQKRGSLDNPLFQKFSPEGESEVLIFWVATCFTDINIAKKGLLLAAVARNICIFLLRDMTVPICLMYSK